MSCKPTFSGLPPDIMKWLDTAVQTDGGWTSLLAYGLARAIGLDPTQSVASAVLFDLDAARTWTDAGSPTRRELFATAERTLPQPPP